MELWPAYSALNNTFWALLSPVVLGIGGLPLAFWGLNSWPILAILPYAPLLVTTVFLDPPPSGKRRSPGTDFLPRSTSWDATPLWNFKVGIYLGPVRVSPVNQNTQLDETILAIHPIDPMIYYAFNSWGIAEGRQKTKKDWIRMYIDLLNLVSGSLPWISIMPSISSEHFFRTWFTPVVSNHPR